jgi:hypothetical protein
MSQPHDLSRDAALEALLRQALDRAGEPAPFPVDVADAVMARVATVGSAPRAEIGWRQFTQWAIAASLIGVALVVAAAWHGPAVSDLAHDFGRTTADSMGTATKLTEPAVTTAAALGRSAVVLFEAARTVVRPLEALRPLAQLLLVLVAAAMAGFSAVVVGRDLRDFTPQKEQA